MTQAHALSFNLAEEFIPYVAKHCIAVNDDGEEAFDFGVAEAFLIERYFRNKPLLNLRLRGFNYADDVQADRANLGAKVKQEPIPHAMQQRIREQLVGIAAAQNALAQIETAANFLSATLSSAGSEGRGAIGELLLGERLTLDMRMSEEEQGRLGSTITQQIKLKHIDGLCEMLRQLVGSRPAGLCVCLVQGGARGRGGAVAEDGSTTARAATAAASASWIHSHAMRCRRHWSRVSSR